MTAPCSPLTADLLAPDIMISCCNCEGVAASVAAPPPTQPLTPPGSTPDPSRPAGENCRNTYPPPRLMPPHPSWHSSAQLPGHTSLKRRRCALRSPAGGSKCRPSHRGRAGPASENHCQNVIAMRTPLPLTRDDPEGAYSPSGRKSPVRLSRRDEQTLGSARGLGRSECSAGIR